MDSPIFDFILGMAMGAIAYGLGYIQGVRRARAILVEAKMTLSKAERIAMRSQELMQVAKRIAGVTTGPHE